MYKKDAIKKARELNPDYNYLTDNQVLDAIQKAIPDIKLEDEPFGYSVTKPIDDLGVDIAKGADNFIGDASSTVIWVWKKFWAFENINPEDLTTPWEILGLRDDKYEFWESWILGRTAKRWADFVERWNESAQAYNEWKQWFGETAFQIWGKWVWEVSETIWDAFMSLLKTVAPTETEDYVKKITSDFVNENEYTQGVMQILQEYEKRKKWLKENSPEDYRNLEASVWGISGLVDMLWFGAWKKAVEWATSAQVKEMTKQLATKLNEGLKTSWEMIKNIKWTVVNWVKRTWKTIENLWDNWELFPAITDNWIKFEIAKPNITYRINDKLFWDNLWDLASQAVKPRINIRKGYKWMVRSWDDVLNWINSLYDDFADWIINADIQTMKWWVEWLEEAKSYWWKVIWDLSEWQVNNIDITDDTLKALNKIDNDELMQIDDMFPKVSKIMNTFAKTGWDISIKRIQEKLSSIKWDIFSNAETVWKLTSTESWRVLGDFLNDVTSKLDEAISKIDWDGMWKKAKSKYATYSKLENDFVKSFMVNNRNSKNWLSGVAGNMAWIAQILSDQSVKWAVKSLALKFAWDIIGYNKTRAWAWEKLIRKLHLKSIENAKKIKDKSSVDLNNSNITSSMSSTNSSMDAIWTQLSQKELLEATYWKELTKSFNKLKGVQKRTKTIKWGDKMTDIEWQISPAYKSFYNDAQDYIHQINEDMTVQELFDKMDDVRVIEKPKYIPSNNPVKIQTEKEMMDEFDSIFWKWESTMKYFENEEKILTYSEKVAKTLWVWKEKLLTIANTVKEYAKKYWAELKDKLWELIDDLADKLWIRSKFVDDWKMSSKTLDNWGQKNIIGSDFKTNTEPMKNINSKEAKTIIDETIQNEWGTYDIVDGKIQNKFGSDNISISLFPNRSKIITKKELSEKVIQDYIEANKDLLSKDNFTLGTWVNDKWDLYLDVATLLPRNRKSEILKLWEKYNQEWVFDLKEWEFISTNWDWKVIKVDEQKAIQDLEKLLPKKDAWKQNVEFFTEKSAKASSDIPYEINKDLIKDVPEKIVKDFDKYTMWGNFTWHIAKMIPTFAEKQLKVTNTISKNAKSFLDIWASEGWVVKTVADNWVKKAVALDPNRQMFENFKKTPEVKNAEYELKAFWAEWVEDDGFKVLEYKPKEKFDAINEDFAFQFMHPDRDAQVKLAKSMLNDDWVFISQEKFNPENANDKVWLANEAKKYDHQRKYFNEDQLTEDKQTIVSWMADDMVSKSQYEKVLKDNFKYVEQFWDAWNFKWFIASDSKKTIDKYLKDIWEITWEFDTRDKLKIPKEELYNKMVLEWKKVIDSDVIKKYIRGYNPKHPDRVHQLSSKIADELTEKLIKDPNIKKIKLLAGWGGSWKSEVLLKWILKDKEKWIGVVDGTLKTYSKARKLIDKVKAEGKTPEVEASYVDFDKALEFNNKRDRTVPEEILYNTHKWFRQTLLKLAEDGDIRINLKVNKGVRLPNWKPDMHRISKKYIRTFMQRKQMD